MTNARLVIVFLGAVLLLSVAGLIWLAHDGISTPDVLVALPSGALGALSAFLVKSSTDSPINVEAAQNVNTGASEPTGGEHRRQDPPPPSPSYPTGSDDPRGPQ